MFIIKCGFCKKDNKFDENDIRYSGKAILTTCKNCRRSITIGFNKEIYYKEDNNEK